MAKKKRKKTKKSDAEKIAEKLEKIAQEAVKEVKKTKKKTGGKKKSSKKKKKGKRPEPKRGFVISKTVLDILLAVKRFGKGRDKVNEIYEATGRNTHRVVNGKRVMTKKYQKWKELFEKLKEKGYITLSKDGYRLTPAGHNLLRNRLIRKGRVPKGVKPNPLDRPRGETIKPAREYRRWGVLLVDKRRDAYIQALPPGKRRSKSGNIYYEYRPNRSDIPGETPVQASTSGSKKKKKKGKKGKKKGKNRAE